MPAQTGPDIGAAGIEPVDTEPVDIEVAEIEAAEIELADIVAETGAAETEAVDIAVETEQVGNKVVETTAARFASAEPRHNNWRSRLARQEEFEAMVPMLIQDQMPALWPFPFFWVFRRHQADRR